MWNNEKRPDSNSQATQAPHFVVNSVACISNAHITREHVVWIFPVEFEDGKNDIGDTPKSRSFLQAGNAAESHQTSS